ncbi:type II toxin-antitoxin system RelE/ParE family toxin [Endozoicomonas sp. ALC013]|uniref:type II toxin-antitoxin system RelE/ParE family toxin n=1 Tax=Endozoicomonas sp. ALC013 TaxID=3403076 RepID=UPI003BB78530
MERAGSLIKLYYTPEFKRSLGKLLKKYHSLREDLKPLLTELTAGKTPGDRLQVSGAVLYKARIRNRDASRGKSGGYRVIYYLKTKAKTILVTIYSKSDQADIKIEKVQNIIDRYLKK